MESIKKRLMRSYVILVVLSLIVLELFLGYFVRQYYYSSVEENLTNQIKSASEFYTRYFSNSTLDENILDNVDVFWKQTSAQVQIIDINGRMLMDSIGVVSKNKVSSKDFEEALKGGKGKFIGNMDYDTSPVMAISYPLKSDGKVVGVIRFISSLSEVNKGIAYVCAVFFSLSLVVIIIATIVSLFLSNSIVIPIKELTEAAEKMARGEFNIRSEKKFNDEIGKLSDTLNYMAEEIVKKEQLKNEFISSVSHELRTPLTSIKGWAITLNDKEQLDDKETLNVGLSIIEKESERLTSMVEELLDFQNLYLVKLI